MSHYKLQFVLLITEQFRLTYKIFISKLKVKSSIIKFEAIDWNEIEMLEI